MEVVQGKSSREVGASLGRVWPPEGLHGEGLQELLEFQKESPGMDSPQGWSDGAGRGRAGAAEGWGQGGDGENRLVCWQVKLLIPWSWVGQKREESSIALRFLV